LIRLVGVGLGCVCGKDAREMEYARVHEVRRNVLYLNKGKL